MSKTQRQILAVLPTLLIFFYPLLARKIRDQLGMGLSILIVSSLACLGLLLASIGYQNAVPGIVAINGLSFLFFFAFVFDSDQELAGTLNRLALLASQWMPRLLSLLVTALILFFLYRGLISQFDLTIEFGKFGVLFIDVDSQKTLIIGVGFWLLVQSFVYLKFWKSSILDYITDDEAPLVG